jgi:hypothetical protein
MRHLERITEHEMVAHFLRTELHSLRFREALLALLRREGQDPGIVDQPNPGSEAENAFRARLLGELRGYRRHEEVFRFVPDDTAWHRYALRRDELARVRYINDDYWMLFSGGIRSLPLR